jgi:hypothetical protein
MKWREIPHMSWESLGWRLSVASMISSVVKREFEKLNSGISLSVSSYKKSYWQRKVCLKGLLG